MYVGIGDFMAPSGLIHSDIEKEQQFHQRTQKVSRDREYWQSTTENV